ncbi:heterokaryon incompatibility protein-domain-containing protein [Apiospora marii]|uniref:Heterokaryon incompatibility protein-domain-containing protein n=1 Tax=Apiospora marii TaxID=335849 RepID=A0ABR1RIG6_9PEZI
MTNHEIDLEVCRPQLGADPTLDIAPPRAPSRLKNQQQLYDSLSVTCADHLIRLHQLDPLPPDSVNEDAPLQGTLRIVSLAASPCFTALSYRWGERTSPARDIIDVRLEETGYYVDIPITTNCHEPLCALRARYGLIHIWVDAICINQVDDVEMASKIPLMGDIYTFAEMVYVWLGQGTPVSKKVFRSLFVLSRSAIFLDIATLGSAPNGEARRRAGRGVRRFRSCGSAGSVRGWACFPL